MPQWMKAGVVRAFVAIRTIGDVLESIVSIAEAIGFAAGGTVQMHVYRALLKGINRVFSDLKAERVDGRVVLNFG